jgi:hypothetical protein
MRLSAIAIYIAAIPSIALASNDEHILLCNCSDRKGQLSSVMAYYFGNPDGFPAAVASMATGRNTVWESAPVSGTFPGGDTFISNIAASIPAESFAGIGKNNLGSLSCYRKAQVNAIPLLDGTMCSPLYDCNHTPPETPVPNDQLRIDYALNGNYIDLTGASILDPTAILGTVWSRRSEHIFDDSDINIGGGCSISFHGHGVDSWHITNGLAQVLMSQVATRDNLIHRWNTISNSTYCIEYCEEDEDRCCRYEQKTTPHMKMAQTVSIYATDVTSKSDRGELTYTISCIPPPHRDCDSSKELRYDLGDLALAAEVGTAFGATGAILGVISLVDEC